MTLKQIQHFHWINLQFKDSGNLTGLIEIEIEVVFVYMFGKIFQVGNINTPEYWKYTPEDVESIFIKINLIKTKWFFCGCYYPPGQSDQYIFENIGKTLDKNWNILINLCLLVISTLKNYHIAHHNSFMNTMPRTLSSKTLILKMHWILAVFIFL